VEEYGGIGWGWQAMDSKHCAGPLGGQKTGKNPTDIAPRTETTSRTDSILQVSLWLSHVLLYNRDRCVKPLTGIRTMDPSLDLQAQRLFVATALITQVLRNCSGLSSPPCSLADPSCRWRRSRRMFGLAASPHNLPEKQETLIHQLNRRR
jgi:hypothetical protein